MNTAISRLAPASDLARIVLRVDATVATASGVILIAGARPISDFLGVGSAVGLFVLGAVSLPYAALLLIAAGRSVIERRSVLVPAALNISWVVGSIALLVIGTPAFSTGGRWAVAVAADVGAMIALAQFIALRRMGRASA